MLKPTPTWRVESDVAGMPYGGVYAKISAAALANPGTKPSRQRRRPRSRAKTLRGLLLEAYAFGTFGTISLWAGIAAFILAGLMLILVFRVLGTRDRVPDDVEILGPPAK